MIQVESASNESIKSESGAPHQQHSAQTPIERFLQKLSRLELPAKEHFESYLRHKWRLNHKRSTLQGSFASVRLFLEFYGKSGKRDLSEMERADLEAFIEHLQDWRIKDLHGADKAGLPDCLSPFPDGTGSHLRGRPEETD